MNIANGLKDIRILVVQFGVFVVYLGFSRQGKPSRGSNQWLWISEQVQGQMTEDI